MIKNGWEKIFKTFDSNDTSDGAINPQLLDPNFTPVAGKKEIIKLGRRISPSYPRGGAPEFSLSCTSSDCRLCRKGEMSTERSGSISIESLLSYPEESNSSSSVPETENDTPPSPFVKRNSPIKGDETLLLVREKDVEQISTMLEKLKQPNGYTADFFEREDQVFVYEVNQSKDIGEIPIGKFQYHPLVRRLHKGTRITEETNIKYELTEDKTKFRHKIEPRRTTSKIIKQKNPAGLCPYCEKIVFAEFKNSTYLHHLNKQHGVFSNGDSIPTPLSYAVYETEGKKVKVEGVECPDCSLVIPLSATPKPLLGYLRHYSDEHKKGSKLDLKAERQKGNLGLSAV